MKTTNLEISKKLKEIGFDAETFFFWTKAPKLTKTDKDRYVIALANNVDISKENEMFPAYHLETLIEALPEQITTEFKHFDTNEFMEFEETLKIYKSGIRYSHNEDDIDYIRTNYGYYSTFDLNVNEWEGESLADTAGRLLIQLSEAGIINFKK